jgi:hypothetical protein
LAHQPASVVTTAPTGDSQLLFSSRGHRRTLLLWTASPGAAPSELGPAELGWVCKSWRESLFTEPFSCLGFPVGSSTCVRVLDPCSNPGGRPFLSILKVRKLRFRSEITCPKTHALCRAEW